MMSKSAVKLLVALIGTAGVIIAALITTGAIHLFPQSSNYIPLHSSYTGNATGYSSGPMILNLGSENQQGNVSMQVTFGQAIYPCEGDVTSDNHLTLDCSKQGESNYLLSVQGFIYPDGHIAGTMMGTNTRDMSYVHNYNWSAS